MSEVQRYYLGKYGLVEGEALGRINVVLGDDHDRVTAERDALRNEVGQVKGEYDRAVNKVDALQQRLNVADERVDLLERLLANAYETAAKWVEKRCDAYVGEHGSSDPETGAVEFPGDGEEYVGELMEIADGLRALKQAEPAKDEHVCTGCGSKGWTANCSECVPY